MSRTAKFRVGDRVVFRIPLLYGTRPARIKTIMNTWLGEQVVITYDDGCLDHRVASASLELYNINPNDLLKEIL